MEAPSVGIVGAGRITEQMHLPVLVNVPEARLAWITDVEEERARRLGRAYGVPAVALPEDPGLLPPCEVALLAVPLQVRRPYYEAFAARGTAVMAEKPFASGTREHRDVLGLFAAHRIGCFYQRRFYRNTLAVRRILRESWFGPARSLRIREGDRIRRAGTDASHFDDLRLAGGGVLLSLGCHALDWAIQVTGADRYEISEARFELDEGLDRKAQARITLFGEGGAVELDTCVSWIDPQPNRVDVSFDGARLSFGTGVDAALEVRGRDGSDPPAELSPRLRGATTPNQAFFLAWSSFLEGLRTGTPSEVSAAGALLTTSLIEDLYRRGREP